MRLNSPRFSTRSQSPPSGLFFRRNRLVVPSLALLLMACLAGCATFNEATYFKAVRTDKAGNTSENYYKVTIKGNGQMARDYKVRAGYLSADTVDVLSGDIPTVPEADFNKEEYAAFRHVKDQFQSKLKKQSEDLEIDGCGKDGRESLTDFAKEAGTVGWLASVSDKDFISMGQQNSTNPYVYRKFVIYTTAKDLNLTEYDKDVNDAIEKTGALAAQFRAQRQARKDEKKQEHDAKQNAMRRLFPSIFSAAGITMEPEDIQALMGLVYGAPVTSE